MDHNGHPLSRRRLLVGTAAASAVTLAGVTAAQAAATAGPPRAAAPLVTRDRIATALLRTPAGRLTTARLQVDFHDRLTAWLAFWSANSPHSWSTPTEVVAEVAPDGDTLTLHAIRYTHRDQVRTGFAASKGTLSTPAVEEGLLADRGHPDGSRIATLASLHHHFADVRLQPDGAVRVADGTAGPTGTTDQVAFAVAACRRLWDDRTATPARWREHANRVLARTGHRADVASRAGWAAFTRTSLRRGLGTETYE